MNKVMSVSGLALWIMVFSFSFLVAQPVEAETACTVSVSPSSIKGGSTTTVNFTVQNLSDTDDISDISISTTAVDEFQIQTVSSSGWSGSIDSSNHASFSGGVISTGGSQSFSLSLAAIDQDQATIGWDVYAAGIVLCTGQPGVAIYKSSSSDGLSLSNIGVTGIQQSRASIVWTSSAVANSYAEYGTTSSYGSATSDSTSSTAHSLTITGLSSGTTYHYRVRSTDSQGNIATSGDFTFTTVSTSSSTTTTTTTTEYVTATPTPTPVPDRVKPVVEIKTELKKPYVTAPKIEGTAQDNVRVDAIEYSLDGGKNWIAVRSGGTLKKAKVSYSFTPVQTLDDGNYTLVVRATDDAGNVGVSKPITMIIDRLPPSVGPMIVHAGPLLYEPTATGVFEIASGIRTSITFSAVGGPTQVVLRIGSQTFQAHKYLYSGLWKTSFTLDQPGMYPIVATATDGAGNVTSRSLGSVTALTRGRIEEPGNARGVLTVYVKQNQRNEFVQWNGAPYDMQNPLHLDENGEYTLILPAGEYYLRATAPGAVPVNSEIFRIDTPTAIIQSFRLRAYQTVWDLWQSEAVPVVITQLRQSSVSKQKWGFPFPAFQLEKQGRTFTELDLRGATTLVTVLNAWSPSTQHQLPYLRSLAEDGQVRVVVVFPHERESTLELLSSQLGNKIVAIADTDGTLSSRLGVVTAPMHLILNHQAIIQNIVYGVHSPDELRSYLIH